MLKNKDSWRTAPLYKKIAIAQDAFTSFLLIFSFLKQIEGLNLEARQNYDKLIRPQHQHLFFCARRTLAKFNSNFCYIFK
jgi:hypothetical protein